MGLIYTWSSEQSGAGIPTYANFASLPTNPFDGQSAITLDTNPRSFYIYDAGTMAWNLVAGGAGIGVTSITPVGSAPNANGGTISGVNLTLQPADGTNPGVLTAISQTIGGAKTFLGAISASNLSGTNNGDITLGTANGLGLIGQVLSLQLSDATHTGALSSADWNTFNNTAISSYKVDLFTLSNTDITNKFVNLSSAPSSATKTTLIVIGGPMQDYGTDFTVSGSQLSWSTLFLDGVLVSGDKLVVQYT